MAELERTAPLLLAHRHISVLKVGGSESFERAESLEHSERYKRN
jgi:hypothetical protein